MGEVWLFDQPASLVSVLHQSIAKAGVILNGFDSPRNSHPGTPDSLFPVTTCPCAWADFESITDCNQSNSQFWTCLKQKREKEGGSRRSGCSNRRIWQQTGGCSRRAYLAFQVITDTHGVYKCVRVRRPWLLGDAPGIRCQLSATCCSLTQRDMKQLYGSRHMWDSNRGQNSELSKWLDLTGSRVGNHHVQHLHMCLVCDEQCLWLMLMMMLVLTKPLSNPVTGTGHDN